VILSKFAMGDWLNNPIKIAGMKLRTYPILGISDYQHQEKRTAEKAR
jgi:hypothetical protein